MDERQTIELGDITVDVVKKDIKNLHLSVYPPKGNVRISAPQRMDLATIRLFAVSKLRWIKQEQRQQRAQEREAPREYLNRESHYLWGKRYLLDIVEKEAPPTLKHNHSQMILQVRPGADAAKKRAIIDESYRQQLKSAIPPLIAKWEQLMGVTVADFTVRKMKTKWGSCSPESRTIRFNLDLAKKPPIFLEYVVVHEMVHLLEPTHNSHFIALMDKFMPKWKFYRDVLNRLPVTHERWDHYKDPQHN